MEDPHYKGHIHTIGWHQGFLPLAQSNKAYLSGPVISMGLAASKFFD